MIPLAIFSHPAGPFLHGLVVPGVRGGFNSTSVLLIIAIVGTTVAPWQLFFQQSNIIDKRITPRWINYERADTFIGSLVVVFAASVLMAVPAAAFAGTPGFGDFTNAVGVARGLEQYVGHGTGAIFAIILLNASIIGAAAVTLSTSYAFGDVFGARHSLHRSWRDAKLFYGTFSGMVVLAAGLILIPGAPLGVITTAVQALAGVLLPSATVFLLLLCNDKDVLGPWVNRPWLNVVAVVHRLGPAHDVAHPDGDDDVLEHQRDDAHRRPRRGADRRLCLAGGLPVGEAEATAGTPRPPANLVKRGECRR